MSRKCNCGSELTQIAEGDLTNIWICAKCGLLVIDVIEIKLTFSYGASLIEAHSLRAAKPGEPVRP